MLLDDIVADMTVVATTKFEEALFAFIRAWFTGVEHFSLTTSGSTGAPKRIAISRAQMMESARLTVQALQLTAGQTALICLSPEFIAGKMMIVRCLVADLRIVAVDPSSHPLHSIEQRIDFTAMVPLQVHDLLSIHHHSFANIGTVIIGGGAVAPEDIQMIQRLSCRFYATYGMTETVSHVALRRLNGAGASQHYSALPGITFARDDRNCLVIHWPIFGASIVTNDLVELLDREKFIWLGRWDNVINSGGRKILPETLEIRIGDVMKNAGYGDRFFIAGIPDVRLGTKMVLILESDDSDQNYSSLITLLKSSLQSFEVPKAILTCFPFIETQTGKINRNTTLELAISNTHSTD
ncbi:MAG: AMP-binding protein [Chryseolinea sp.]